MKAIPTSHYFPSSVCPIITDKLQSHQCLPASTFNHWERWTDGKFQIKPDLGFGDLALGNLDGYEFCTMLGCSRFRDTPIIILGTQDLFFQRIKARMLRATEYLITPITEKNYQYY